MSKTIKTTFRYFKLIKKVFQTYFLFDQLIKLHKPDYPIRPAVAYVTVPATKISRKLIEIIKDTCTFNAKFSIKNSYELVEKIKKVNCQKNVMFISLDVENLFQRIPLSETQFS